LKRSHTEAESSVIEGIRFAPDYTPRLQPPVDIFSLAPLTKNDAPEENGYTKERQFDNSRFSVFLNSRFNALKNGW
jgi:hypothetical protein